MSVFVQVFPQLILTGAVAVTEPSPLLAAIRVTGRLKVAVTVTLAFGIAIVHAVFVPQACTAPEMETSDELHPTNTAWVLEAGLAIKVIERVAKYLLEHLV